MTLYDLFTGHFTWRALFSAFWPPVIVAVSAFYAGYWRGRVVEQRETLRLMDKLKVPR